MIHNCIIHYNYERYRPDLGCQSPMETLLQIDIDLDLVKELKISAQNRLKQNQAFDCSRLCTTLGIPMPEKYKKSSQKDINHRN